jgi:hypothetical protein
MSETTYKWDMELLSESDLDAMAALFAECASRSTGKAAEWFSNARTIFRVEQAERKEPRRVRFVPIVPIVPGNKTVN